MSLIVEESYPHGVPQSAVSGFSPTGCAWHWSAGGPGRAGWLGTVQHLINTRGTVNASYHGGFWCEHTADHRGCRTIIQWIVRVTSAAHSMAPSKVFQINVNKDRVSQDARFGEVRRILGAKAADPNAGCIAIAYAGMPADLARDLACPVFRADVRQLAADLVAHPATVDRPHFGHGWIQPIDRYEMDAPAADFISMLYGTDPVQEEDMLTPALHYVPQLWKANAGGAELREQADIAAPVIGLVPAGTVILTLGEAQSDRQGWRLALAGDPERLYYVRRAQITALPPTPRDQALYDGIATVVNARAAGQPVPVGGGVPKADHDAVLAQVAALTKRIQTKDAHVAGYPKG